MTSDEQLREWAKAMHALAWVVEHHTGDDVLAMAYTEWAERDLGYREEKLGRWARDPVGFMASLDTAQLRRLVAGMVVRYDGDAHERTKLWGQPVA